MEKSFEWVEEYPTDNKLQGTSVIEIKSVNDVERAIELIKAYVGKTLLLVEGYRIRGGNDLGEAIFEDCTVKKVYDYNILREE